MQGRFDGWRWFGTAGRGEKRGGKRRKTRKHAARFERLESRELLTVTYNGGALLTNVEAQAVYLGSQWASNASLQSQASATDQFLSTLVNGPYMDMLTNAGYDVGRGTATAGAVDNININSVALSDNQIQNDLAAMIAGGQVQAPDANRLYMVYVEPGAVVQMGSATSQTSFLGYHGAFADGNSVIHYAVVPYPGSPNPTPSSQGFSSAFNESTAVSSHELAEAVTDPNVNYGTLGWYDYQNNGEIADLAEGHYATITGSNGAQYTVQDVVNQNDQIISPASTTSTPPSTTPPASTTLSAPGLTVTAASSTAANLSWTAVSGVQGYRVYQVNGGQSTLLGTVAATATSVQVTGLTPGATEAFKIEAYNSTAVADSSVVSVVMPGGQSQYVTVPQLTATAASSTSVVLKWNLESQAQGYRIYWSNGYQSVFLGSVGAATNSVTITGLAPGSGSYFLVEAFNASSYADSAWVPVTTPYFTVSGNAAQDLGAAENGTPRGTHEASPSAVHGAKAGEESRWFA